MSSTDDFLFGSGSASAKFDNVGDSITGQVVTTEVKQQTDIQSGNPLTWDNGDPRMQLVVTLQTDLREPREDGTEDDGKRNLYVKGSKKAGSKSLHDAVASAVRAAGAQGLKPGGTLTVQYIGTEPSATRGFNDRKLYAAQYIAPDPSVASAGFFGNAEPAAASPWNGAVQTAPAQAQPVTAAPVAAAPVGPTQEQINALQAAGIDPATVYPSLANAGAQPPF